MRTAASLGARVFAEQRKHIFQCVKPLYDEPLAIAEGSECWVRDYDGREYLDAFAGILTTSPGHCHPAVVSAVQEPAARVGHLSTLYVNDRQIWTIQGVGAQSAPARTCARKSSRSACIEWVRPRNSPRTSPSPSRRLD